MNYKKILVTGGAGFVGSNIAVKLKEHFKNINVICIDNLMRKGSELNLPRLKKHGVKFIYGDVRNVRSFDNIKFDLMIECSAEPSVTAGTTGSPRYLIDTNLGGAVNCFEAARVQNADVIFLSTSRVYPFDRINKLKFIESNKRFEPDPSENTVGISTDGISEKFNLEGIRSMYGASKLSAEYVLREYIESYKMRGIIIRFGVIAGPWQFGKVDQGVVTHWVASHFFNKPLTYFGYGGSGKQVRDIVHIDDVFRLIVTLTQNMDKVSGQIMNSGGGIKNSISLAELTTYCREIIGIKIPVNSDYKTRLNDLKWYVTDNSQVKRRLSWNAKCSINQIIEDTFFWIKNYSVQFQHIFN